MEKFKNNQKKANRINNNSYICDTKRKIDVYLCKGIDMEKIGYIEIRIEGNRNGKPISPKDFDIKELRKILEAVDKFFDNDRELISLQIENGSVLNKLITSLALATAFNANLAFINTGEIERVPDKYIAGINEIVKFCKSGNYLATITTSESRDVKLTINKDFALPQNSEYKVLTEFNFIGEITDAGGSDRINIHLRTENGSVKIKTDKKYLSEFEHNLLYKEYSVFAEGLVDINTGEYDNDSLQLISMHPFNPVFDANEFDRHVNNTSQNWADVDDVDAWINNIRGYDE